MTERVLLGIASIAVAAVLAGWLGSSRAEERSARVAFSANISAPRFAAALRDARAARRLMPDAPARLVEARLLYVSGRRSGAQRLLDRVVRREPENSDAWVLLLNTTRDPERERKARARIRELNPLLSGRGG
jgi:predicted Zn-dependent protease